MVLERILAVAFFTKSEVEIINLGIYKQTPHCGWATYSYARSYSSGGRMPFRPLITVLILMKYL